MNKIIIAIAVLFSTISYSQTQDVFGVMAKETCECVTAKKLDLKTLEAKQVQVEFGICIIKSFSTHQDEIKKVDQIDYSDKVGMRKFGEKIGLKMIDHCPDLLVALGMSINEKEDAAAAEEAVEYKFAEGEIIEIKSEQFVTIKVKDKNARAHQLILLDYFETASLLTNNKIKKGDRIIANYNEIELYDAKEKEFRFFKVITNLVKNN